MCRQIAGIARDILRDLWQKKWLRHLNFDYNLNLWFENVAQFVQKFPVNFSFNLLSLWHFAIWEILKWVILSYLLFTKKIFWTLLAIFISNIIGNKWVSILESKGSVRCVQKEHFTMVTQVDVFLPGCLNNFSLPHVDFENTWL